MRWYRSIWAIILLSLLSGLYGVTYVHATSTSATSTFNIVAVVPGPPQDPGGGGGGGGSPVSTPTEVSFSGFAYPSSVVTILKDGQLLGQTTARIDSRFDFLATSLTGGTYLFSLSANDFYNNNSTPDTHTVVVVSNARTTISGIVVPPTVSLDKSEVKQSDPIVISGQGMQDSTITIKIVGVSTTTPITLLSTFSVTSGLYQYVFDTTPLALGTYGVSVKSQNGSAGSAYSQETFFIVGEKNIVKKDFLIGDVNYDDRVNIADFSITAFWYKQVLSPAFIIIENERLTGDSTVTLRDFSLMAYYWTG